MRPLYIGEDRKQKQTERKEKHQKNRRYEEDEGKNQGPGKFRGCWEKSRMLSKYQEMLSKGMLGTKSRGGKKQR
jgi:hypothetical protein